MLAHTWLPKCQCIYFIIDIVVKKRSIVSYTVAAAATVAAAPQVRLWFIAWRPSCTSIFINFAIHFSFLAVVFLLLIHLPGLRQTSVCSARFHTRCNFLLHWMKLEFSLIECPPLPWLSPFHSFRQHGYGKMTASPSIAYGTHSLWCHQPCDGFIMMRIWYVIRIPFHLVCDRNFPWYVRCGNDGASSSLPAQYSVISWMMLLSRVFALCDRISHRNRLILCVFRSKRLSTLVSASTHSHSSHMMKKVSNLTSKRMELECVVSEAKMQSEINWKGNWMPRGRSWHCFNLLACGKWQQNHLRKGDTRSICVFWKLIRWIGEKQEHKPLKCSKMIGW